MSLRGPGLSIYKRGRRPSLRIGWMGEDGISKVFFNFHHTLFVWVARRFSIFLYGNLHFLSKLRPPKLKREIRTLLDLHISFQTALCNYSPHFFLRLPFLTTILFKVALAHHISFNCCTYLQHFFLRLHLLTTFLFTMQKLFLSRFRVTFAMLVATSGFYPNAHKDHQRF